MFERITDPTSLDPSLMAQKVEDGEVVIQFSEKNYTDALLSEINKLCAHHGDRIEVRFYSFYGSSFDCSELSLLPDVANLSIDCIDQVTNLDVLGSLSNLRVLSLGVYDLKRTDILALPNLRNLQRLAIGEAKKNCDLSYLSEYQNLKSLDIVGHTKNIDAAGDIKGLKTLRLISIPSKQPLEFVNELEHLENLEITLGGRQSISEITNPSIRSLSIIRVRGFSELTHLDRFPRLTTLQVEDQIRLRVLGFSPANSELGSIRILNCKTFESLTGIEHLPKLHEMRIYGTSIDFDSFIGQEFPKGLKILAFYEAGHSKRVEERNEQMRQKLEDMGYAEFSPDH